MSVFAVIGSNCFTGSHIVDALLQDPSSRVIGVSRSPEYNDLFLPYKLRENGSFSFHQIDLVRQFDDLVSLFDRVQPQIVINVAALSEVALSHERPGEYFETNTLGVVRLCDYLRTRPWLERYVHISSAEVFGSCDTPATEETPFNPSTPYAVSKAAADMHLNTLLANFGFPVTIVRSTNVYGKHQQLFKIIPRTAIYMNQNKTIALHGGGQAIKSFVHVRDVVRGVLASIKHGHPGTYHFTAAGHQSVADIVRQVCEWMGRDFATSTAIVEERTGQDARYWLDCSKAEHELGWRPTELFEQGVREVISWIEESWEKVQREPLVYVHKA